MQISESQKDVLFLLTKEFLTTKQIASRRQTSVWAIYKIINKLRKKGLLNATKKIGGTKLPVPPPSTQKTQFFTTSTIEYIRLHGIQLKMAPFYFNKNYSKYVKTTHQDTEGETKFWKDVVELYIFLDFMGKSEDEVEQKAYSYILSKIRSIEDKYKVSIIKEGKTNIMIVKSHYAHICNGIAREHNKKGINLCVRTSEDGKAWLITDKSKGLDELECIHPETAKEDSKIISRYTNDWRQYVPPTNSELALHLKDIINVVGGQIVHTTELERKTADITTLLTKVLNPQDDQQSQESQTTLPEYIG